MDCGQRSSVSNFTRKKPTFLNPKHTSARIVVEVGLFLVVKPHSTWVDVAGGGGDNGTNREGKMSGNILAFMHLYGQKAGDQSCKVAPSKEVQHNFGSLN